jgi:uncharacterized protein (TIGR02145 family)
MYMSKIIKVSYLLIVMIGLLFLITNSCKKDKSNNDNNDNPITLKPIVFNPNLTYGTLTDIDGNVYKTIQIGTQTWMAENLKVTHYRDGSDIPIETNYSDWSGLTTGAYCWWGKDVASYKKIYGALYNWFAVNDSRKLAPAGWHIPADYEWTALTDYLGQIDAGTKMKEVGTTHWIHDDGQTNESGFTGLPGDYRGDDEAAQQIGYNAYWWSSTEINTSSAWNRSLDYGDAVVEKRFNQEKWIGASVRCVKD